MPDTKLPGTASSERFFIPHLMKTGGTTLTWHARATFGLNAVYPYEPAGDGPYLDAYTSVSHMLNRVTARVADIRVVMGHVPYAVLDALPGHWRSIVVVRHPLERIRSLLADQSRRPGPCEGLAPWDIYRRDDIRLLTDDHQTRMLGARMPVPDRPLPEGLPCDGDTVQRAHAALEAIDFLGTQEHYDLLLERLSVECNWNVSDAADQNVGPPMELPDSLVEQILEDNQLDAALYQRAVALVEC